jgi:patatin-like phospholipase/acyl hydrolase
MPFKKNILLAGMSLAFVTYTFSTEEISLEEEGDIHKKNINAVDIKNLDIEKAMGKKIIQKEVIKDETIEEKERTQEKKEKKKTPFIEISPLSSPSQNSDFFAYGSSFSQERSPIENFEKKEDHLSFDHSLQSMSKTREYHVEGKLRNDSCYLFTSKNHLKEKFNDGDFNKYILTLDGGGIRGALQMRVLKGIEEELNTKLYSIFDLIGGTSIGGVHALGISAGVPLDDMINMYEQHAAKVFATNGFFNTLFRQPWFFKGALNGLFSPRYDNTFMSDFLAKRVGKTRTMDDLNTHTFVSIYDIEQSRTTVVESWDDNDKHILLSDAGAATSAAPTYFKAQKIDTRHGKKRITKPKIGEYIAAIDGGIGVNNPITLGVAEMIKLWGNDEDLNPFLLSVGTGGYNQRIFYEKARKMGVLSWAPIMPNLFMQAQSTIAEYEADRLLGNYRYARFQKVLSSEDAILDNVSKKNVKNLFMEGQSIVRSPYFEDVMKMKFTKFYPKIKQHLIIQENIKNKRFSLGKNSNIRYSKENSHNSHFINYDSDHEEAIAFPLGSVINQSFLKEENIIPSEESLSKTVQEQSEILRKALEKKNKK